MTGVPLERRLRVSPSLRGRSVSKLHVSSLTNSNVAVTMSEEPLRVVALFISCTRVKKEFMLSVKWLRGWHIFYDSYSEMVCPDLCFDIMAFLNVLKLVKTFYKMC